MRTKSIASAWVGAAALALVGCGLAPVASVEVPGSVDAGPGVVTPARDGGVGTAPHVVPIDDGDAGSTASAGDRDAGGGSPSDLDAGSTTSTGSGDAGSTTSTGSADAGSTTSTGSTDAGSTTSTGSTDAGSTTSTGSATPRPSFGSWAWSAPDPTAIVHAGFNWFESGYPGTLSASDNAYLTQHGTLPIAYINMSEVPNDDSYLQGQIGSFWSSIALCQNTSWNTTVVDVRDSRWQDWLERRANDAYALGNRGIKWDVASVESLCNGWSGDATAQQQAIDAMVKVLTDLRAQHPDLKFIVNQGFGLAEQHPELIDGFVLENMINYADANPGDSWSSEMISRVGAIHTNGHIPIFDLEYYDLFGCSDTACAYADHLYSQIVQLDWVPYITVVDMNVQGRGLNITPPW